MAKKKPSKKRPTKRPVRKNYKGESGVTPASPTTSLEY